MQLLGTGQPAAGGTVRREVQRGALVRLSSDRLAVVVEQNPATLLAPRVRVFYSAKSRTHLLRVDVDLATAGERERIVGVESPAKWGFRDLEKLWLP